MNRRTLAAIVYGLAFVWIGILHWVDPERFVAIMPPYFGAPKFWVLLTGVTEILLGLGIMWPRFRRPAAIWMMIQLACLYLANLHMWRADLAFEGVRLGTTGHIARLVVQIALILAASVIGEVWPWTAFARWRGRRR